MKRCSKCKKQKDESEFTKAHKNKDGLGYVCKDCVRAYTRERYEQKTGSVKIYNNYKELHRFAGEVKQKRCGRCKKWKAESDFYKRRRNKDGLAVWCKGCANKATNSARKKRLAISITPLKPISIVSVHLLKF
jgi:protein-arginine kinase activator protein McsA